MTTKILRKSTLALIFALLTPGLGKTSVQTAPPAPIPSNPTLQIADIGGGDPDPCGNGTCVAPLRPSVASHPTLEVADIGGGDPDPCGNGTCVVGIHLS
jgi:hypothetical protein